MMINLLPNQEKEKLKEEENFRLVLILGILALSFLISLSLIFLSIKFYLEGELQSQKILLEEKEAIISQFQDLKKEVKNLNSSFSKINSFYQRNPDFVEVLETISRDLPPETYLTSFNFNPSIKEKEYLGEISLGGFAPSQEVLLEIKENLKKEKLFSEVSFPLSNWLKPRDIDFKGNFKLKWPQEKKSK